MNILPKNYFILQTFQVRGHYEFRCQHGPAECYGNKLQACVVDALKNDTQAVLYNSCLLQYSSYRSNRGFDYNYIMSWVIIKHFNLISMFKKSKSECEVINVNGHRY